ncbi:MAG: hypothetical protein M1504_02685 [Candidatus Marsarchaeota archaeon]|nr:hypothetical protein [Candidatus Marsarchaeota archaeon]
MRKNKVLAHTLIAAVFVVMLATVLYAAKPVSGGGGGRGGGGGSTGIPTEVQSTYAVNYAYGVNFNPTTNGFPYNVTTLALQSGLQSYYWTAAASVAIATYNYSVDEAAQPKYTPVVNGSDAGHSLTPVGTITQSQPNAHSNDFQGILEGVGAAVNFQDAQITAYADNHIRQDANVTHTYNVTVPGSFVIIDVSGGSANMAPLTSIIVPSTCNVLSRYLESFSNGSIAAEQAVCMNQGAGKYSISWSASGKEAGVTTAAYVFAPYTVNLALNQTGAGAINTDGANYVSGSVSVIGTGPISAVAASGYTFSHWVVSNPANLVIGNATSASTTLEVLGPGTVTADFA